MESKNVGKVILSHSALALNRTLSASACLPPSNSQPASAVCGCFRLTAVVRYSDDAYRLEYPGFPDFCRLRVKAQLPSS
jgi:hypothetical protein